MYIVECKGSEGINQIVRGIGQAYQYYYQKNFSMKSKNAEILFILPKDSESTLTKLMIPKDISVYLVSDDGNVYERVRREFSEYDVELQLPQTFYIRDIELNHIKDIITLIDELSFKKNEVNHILLQKEIETKYPDIAAAGYNHLITLRSMGIIKRILINFGSISAIG
ncbi:MAG: hypothetical protein APG10_01639 [Candidatus Methanofastidiosum methylothiophilum]|uniref:Uncharacterized protein n=1 Tax=Candidatus Methanofastidiosum methylothiophilum TaxID=1705564 RepID=A0A150IHU8_9EURY|nr:MAG: hypothetical protein APG10_01639 [Candidatus Methanofastidiosum methylthiophilus]